LCRRGAARLELKHRRQGCGGTNPSRSLRFHSLKKGNSVFSSRLPGRWSYPQGSTRSLRTAAAFGRDGGHWLESSASASFVT
jgi:hypothetical protein